MWATTHTIDSPSVKLLSLQLITDWSCSCHWIGCRSLPSGSPVHMVNIEYASMTVNTGLPVWNTDATSTIFNSWHVKKPSQAGTSRHSIAHSDLASKRWWKLHTNHILRHCYITWQTVNAFISFHVRPSLVGYKKNCQTNELNLNRTLKRYIGTQHKGVWNKTVYMVLPYL